MALPFARRVSAIAYAIRRHRTAIACAIRRPIYARRICNANSRARTPYAPLGHRLRKSYPSITKFTFTNHFSQMKFVIFYISTFYILFHLFMINYIFDFFQRYIMFTRKPSKIFIFIFTTFHTITGCIFNMHFSQRRIHCFDVTI